MTNKLRAAAQQALEALMDFARFQSMMMDGPDVSDKLLAEDYAEAGFMNMAAAIPALRAALAEQPAEQEPDGLPLVVAGAVFDFAGYITTRSKVIEVGSTANAGPVADLVKEWAKLRGLSLDDAAVLSWQEWLPTAPQPAKQPLTDDEAKAIAYVGPVYAPDGVVTRHPQEYRKELEQHRLDAIRRTEAAHGINVPQARREQE